MSSASFDLVTFDSPDPDRAALFWTAVLDLAEVEREDAGRWIVLAERDAAGTRRIGLQRGVARPGSVHLDLRVDPEDFDAAVAAAIGAGASLPAPTRREPYGRIANLVDPDGNPFDVCAYDDAS